LTLHTVSHGPIAPLTTRCCGSIEPHQEFEQRKE
jgi:hypothetical protein